MSWNDEKTLSFLRMYKNRPLLWDPNCEGYKNKTKRHEMLMELAVYFGIDKSDVEKKIRILQSQFSRERKKEKYFQMSRCVRDDVYTSKWFAYKSMMFLIDRNKPRTMSTIHNEIPINPDIKVKECTNDSCFKHNETDTQKSKSPNKLRNEFPLSNESIIIKRQQLSNSAAKMPVLKEALNLMRTVQHKIEDKDEHTLFGEQVAVRMRKISSPHARFVVQNIINKALFDGEIGVYSSTLNNQPNYFYGNELSASISGAQSPTSSIKTIKSESISEIDEAMLSV